MESRLPMASGLMQVSQSAFAAYQEKIESWLRTTVWNAGCRSWYKTESGRIVNTWPLRAWRYRMATRRLAPENFVFQDKSRTDEL